MAWAVYGLILGSMTLAEVIQGRCTLWGLITPRAIDRFRHCNHSILAVTVGAVFPKAITQEPKK